MKLGYLEFVEVLRKQLLNALNLQEQQIFFKKKAIDNKDRLFVEAFENSSGKQLCGIDVKDLYERCMEGSSMESILYSVQEEIEKLKMVSMLEGKMTPDSYQKIKKYLFVKPLNKKEHDFKKMMYTPGYAGDDFMNVDPYFISDKKKKEGICLSVKGLTNGAVAVLYPEVIKKLVELMDGDFYVVFSSVHEALIHSSKLCSLEELENLLRTSNSRMTFQKEFLTDKVYYYCREKDKFIMLQGSLKMLVTTIRMDEEN